MALSKTNPLRNRKLDAGAVLAKFIHSTVPLRERMLVRGEVLAQFLNDRSERPAQTRVRRLHELCLQLQQRLDAIVGAGQFIMVDYPHLWCWWFRDKQVNVWLQETNRLLSRYRFRRSVPSILRLTEEAPLTVVAAVEPSQRQERRAVSETKAVDVLLSLAEWGALDRVHQCPVCKRWFMAARTDQKYCRQQCNKQQYKLRGEKWNVYMRKYRKRMKDKVEREQNGTVKIWKGERYA